MTTARALGGPIPDRPWTSPGYALGLMHGAIDTGMILSGHTGVGPGSVVAIHRCEYAGNTATCAAFYEGSDQGVVEAEVVRRLSTTLKLGHPSITNAGFIFLVQSRLFVTSVFPQQKPTRELFFSKDKDVSNFLCLYYGARLFLICVFLALVLLYGRSLFS
eukprot:gene49055-60048_t